MKPISTPLSGNNLLTLVLLGALAAGTPALAAVSPMPKEPVPVEGAAAFQETIETRCTVCHSRERVDEAIRAQKDLTPLLQHMVERGAIITEQDRKVLGTFWGSPMKSDNPPSGR